MQMTVKMLTGTSFTLGAEASDTIDTAKAMTQVGLLPQLVGRVNPFACPSDAPGIGGLFGGSFGGLGSIIMAKSHDENLASVGPQSQIVGRESQFAFPSDAPSCGLFGPLPWA